MEIKLYALLTVSAFINTLVALYHEYNRDSIEHINYLIDSIKRKNDSRRLGFVMSFNGKCNKSVFFENEREIVNCNTEYTYESFVSTIDKHYDDIDAMRSKLKDKANHIWSKINRNDFTSYICTWGVFLSIITIWSGDSINNNIIYGNYVIYALISVLLISPLINLISSYSSDYRIVCNQIKDLAYLSG